MVASRETQPDTNVTLTWDSDHEYRLNKWAEPLELWAAALEQDATC